MVPVIDFHCDLLAYLETPKRSPLNKEARCSIPQLTAGGVKLQVFAIYTKTEPNAVSSGNNQLIQYEYLLKNHATEITPLFSFENGSGFCSEEEPLNQGLQRLETIIQTIGSPVYIGLTWNGENRFGGGVPTTVGLKEDGKELLLFLDQKKIAIDFSHASDPLAYDILNYIDQKNLTIPLLASHSNARSIQNNPRNLPNEIAQELFKRKGVIGLNFYQPFVGKTPERLIDHVEHWTSIGGENYIVFGADFFYEKDIHLSNAKNQRWYFDDYQDASCYQKLLQLFQSRLSPEVIKKIAFQNGERWLQK